MVPSSRAVATTRRDHDERHRTLRNTLEWSWDLLDGDVQRAWVAASVPSAPFTPDLRDQLLVPAGCQLDSLDAIEQLCDRSLLTVLAGGADRDVVVDIEATGFDPSDSIVKVGSLISMFHPPVVGAVLRLGGGAGGHAGCSGRVALG